MLEKYNVLDELLKGFKTSMLLPIQCDDREEGGVNSSDIDHPISIQSDQVISV